MTDERTFVIVGGGLAGAKAAETLRTSGFDGRIVLISDESERPYERPPLSKGFLLGKEAREKVFVHGEGFYATHGIELHLGVAVVAIDRNEHEVEFGDGERLRYDKLLLATGSSVVRPRIEGAELDGVRYLRTLAESTSLADALALGGRAVIVGGGWIGLEVAAAARTYGADVVVIEPQPTPLYSVLGPELGEFYAGVHRKHGVDLRLGVGVAAFEDRDGTVSGVRLSTGESIPADIVVVGVGVRPNVELATTAGLLVDDGVVVDEYLRTTDPDIFAAGDVANAHNPLLGRHIRVQHWANANDQGPAAARSMVGFEEPYTKVPYFFSDQYDVGMEYSGFTKPGDYDKVVYRGDLNSGAFCAFWLHEGALVAGMNVNIWDVHSDIRALLKAQARVDEHRLADPAVPLPDVAL